MVKDIHTSMDSFKTWLAKDESTANKRAAMNPGVPAQAGLVFKKPPYSQIAWCNKIEKTPGVRIDNMNTDSICGKDAKVNPSKGKLNSKPGAKGKTNYPNV